MHLLGKHGRRGLVLGAWLVGSIPWVCPAALAGEAGKKPAVFEILVPADAELEVEGYRTQTTGEKRRFESPPVEPGSTYAYSIKATWHGHTVERTVRLRTGSVTTVDLREDLQPSLPSAAPPTPAGSFSLLVPPALMLRPGEKVVLPLRVKRFHFPGPIQVAFEKVPEGVTVEGVCLEEGQTETGATVSAAAGALPGTREIRVLAGWGSARDAATMKITVFRPETVPGNKTEVLTPQPEIRLRLPGAVVLEPGRTTFLEVAVETADGSPLPGEPIVTLAGPDDAVKGIPWTASDFKSQPAAHVLGFAVKAGADARPGEREMKVRVVAGTARVEGSFRVAVLCPEPKEAARPTPACASCPPSP